VTAVALGVIAVTAALGAAVPLARAAVSRRHPSARRIVFPFTNAPSEPVLDAALRLARAEHATLVPVYLAQVPLDLPLEAPLPRQAGAAIGVLERAEVRAAKAGVAYESRIERGRTPRHALRELFAHEPYDRLIVGADVFGPDDVAWVLRNADGEVLVVRPDLTPAARET
jgi:hypothetical protein